MDSEEDRQSAQDDGCLLAIVHVRNVRQDLVGTRSAATAYDVDVIEGESPATLVLKHFGPPFLQVDNIYNVAIIDSGRHHGGWEVRFARVVSRSRSNHDPSW